MEPRTPVQRFYSSVNGRAQSDLSQFTILSTQAEEGPKLMIITKPSEEEDFCDGLLRAHSGTYSREEIAPQVLGF
jgi:hypothetical protein